MEPSPRHVTITQASEEHMDFIVPLFMAYSAFYGQSPAPDRARAYIEDGLARGSQSFFWPGEAGAYQTHVRRRAWNQTKRLASRNCILRGPRRFSLDAGSSMISSSCQSRAVSE